MGKMSGIIAGVAGMGARTAVQETDLLLGLSEPSHTNPAIPMQNYSQQILDRITLRFKSPDLMRQVAALPYAVVEDRVAFLLITSRRTGRWIYPKGSVIDGLERWETAAQEAFEEAGVSGDIAREPIGAYRAIKTAGLRRHVVEVDLYPLRVSEQHDTWPEMQGRHRHWVLLPEAKRLLSDPALADLTVKLGRSLMSS